MMYQFRKMFVHRDFTFCTVLDLRVTCAEPWKAGAAPRYQTFCPALLVVSLSAAEVASWDSVFSSC